MVSRRSSLATFGKLESCPICLELMQECDFAHLLHCKCGFNMCMTCIGSLISSSKDDFQEASDGNLHVKIYLNCPNCRSDLSNSIRDTLLLRKVNALVNNKLPEPEWTDSQIRLKKVLHTKSVQKAISEAKKLERECFGNGENESLAHYDEGEDLENDENFLNDSVSKEYGQSTSAWGVEADITNGVHTSFYVPHVEGEMNPTLIREEAIKIDPTLFPGLDYFLSEEQRIEVTSLMTSGDPFLLAEAAEILYNVARNISPNSASGGAKKFSGEMQTE